MHGDGSVVVDSHLPNVSHQQHIALQSTMKMKL